MSGFYKKAVVWLGLNEEYPDGETMHPHEERGSDLDASSSLDSDETDVAKQSAQSTPAATPSPGPGPSPEARGPKPRPQATSERHSNPLAANASTDRSEGTVRAVPIDEDSTERSGSTRSRGPASGRSQEPSTGTVRAVPMPKTTKPVVVVPQSFNDAQDVADMFRDSQPVIVNMQEAERDLARRMIDFSSGLCYGLEGQMEKVAKDVYLLTPSDVEVADADRQSY